MSNQLNDGPAESKTFLSLKEMAQYLGMGYKAVWRLVLAGDLPASKVGGVYRIRKEDAENFLEKQKVPLSGTVTKSPLGFRETSQEDSLFQKSPGTSCARCLRLIKTVEMVGGECQDSLCDSILCRVCWANERDRYCVDHKPSHEAKLEEVRQFMESGEIDVLVMSEQAYLREIGFISRFDQKIRQMNNLRSPVDGSKIRNPSWDDIHQEYTDDHEVTQLRELVKAPSSTSPRNVWSGYHFSKGKKNKNGGFVIATKVFSHLHAYNENGFDTNPVTRGELAWLLQGLVERARSSHSLYIVGIASPTGWDTEAKESISGEGGERSFSDLNLVPCLIDLQSTQLIYYAHDNRLKPFIHLFLGEFEDETVERVLSFVRNRLQEIDPLTSIAVTKEIGSDREVVKEAFERLNAEGGFTVVKIDKTGLAISKHQ